MRFPLRNLAQCVCLTAALALGCSGTLDSADSGSGGGAGGGSGGGATGGGAGGGAMGGGVGGGAADSGTGGGVGGGTADSGSGGGAGGGTGGSGGGTGGSGGGSGGGATGGGAGDGGSFVPPYSLPGAGSAVTIGTNDPSSILPPGVAWTFWNYALFNSYGGGTFVSDFSAGGAYVIAGSGGHGSPANTGAAVFDFADATWKRLDNANGVPSQSSDFTVAQTSGSPYLEVNGVPAPAHPYNTLAELPAAWGGGSQGSVLYVTRGAVTQSAVSSTSVHRFDLASRLWSRQTQGLGRGSPIEATVVRDSVSRRYWVVPLSLHSEQNTEYLDQQDWTFKVTASYPYLPTFNVTPYPSAFLHESGRLLIFHFIDGLRALDLNNPAASWPPLTVSGTLPSPGRRWVFYPPDGNFYYRLEASGQTLWRLTPPSGDLRTGTWTVDTVTLTGATLPDYVDTNGTTKHYSSLFYVPSLQVMAWVAGGTERVTLLRPP